MRKFLVLSITALGIAAFCACAKEEKSTPVTEKPTVAVEVGQEAAPAETSASAFAGLPNPMVPVTDPAEFEMALGIPFDTARLSKDAEIFIIGGNLAHAAFTKGNGSYVLRATRDTEIVPTMHGIYDSSMSEPVITEVEPEEGKKIALTYTEAKTEKTGIYTWDCDGTYYSLTVDGNPGEAEVAAVLDSCMEAVGIMHPSVTILPLPREVDLKNPEDGIYNVFFETEDLSEDSLTFELFTTEYFDVVDIHLLEKGDVIVVDGEEILIEEIREDNGTIIVNEGLLGDGVEFASNGGGTYCMRGFDDMKSYTDHGETTLPVSPEVVLTDSSDLEKPEPQVITGIGEVKKYLEGKEPYIISRNSTTVRTEKGEIVEIGIIYVP